jgi:hypothetical protein
MFVETVVSSSLVLLAVADVKYAVTGLIDTDDQRWVGKDLFVRAVRPFLSLAATRVAA